MSEQILSQEEIDALLTAMDKGEVELEQKEDLSLDLKKYDLTSQNIMLRDQFSALEEIYDRFVNSVQNMIANKLQKEFEVEYVSTKMLKYADIIKTFSYPTSLNIYSMEPLIGSALMIIETNLVFSLIDCMFGGNGRPIEQVREFTLIEQRIIEKFTLDVLECMEAAWKIVYPVKFQFKSTEFKPEFLNLVAPDDLMLFITFNINGSEFTGSINFCISYLMLEPIKRNLSSTYMIEKKLVNTRRSQIQQLLNKATVSLIGELGRTKSTVRDILNMQINDVIKLPTGPQDTITLNIEGISKYKGYPGIVKGNRAVEISSLFNKNGDVLNNG